MNCGQGEELDALIEALSDAVADCTEYEVRNLETCDVPDAQHDLYEDAVYEAENANRAFAGRLNGA